MRLTVLALAAGIAFQAQAQQPVIAEAPLRAHLSFLADDLFEGRGTGQRGGDLTVAYLEAASMAIRCGKASSGTLKRWAE